MTPLDWAPLLRYRVRVIEQLPLSTLATLVRSGYFCVLPLFPNFKKPPFAAINMAIWWLVSLFSHAYSVF
jgi:hypothetical protein